MDSAARVKKLKDAARRDQRNRKDPRFIRAMGFLIAKGLLKTNLNIAPQPNAKMDARDAFWAAQNCEPRIFEVLPAAILRFPRHFTNTRKLPQEFLTTLYQIKNGENGRDFKGIEFKKMNHWAHYRLPDARLKPLSEKRILKPFRLKPVSIQKLQEQVREGRFRSMTEALEAAIEKL